MSRQNGPPRSLTRIARPREVENAVEKAIQIAAEIKAEYPECYDMALSGRVYPETEPVSSGSGHSDPTGELASGAKNIAMRDDLRRAVSKVGEAVRALGVASSLLGGLPRKADFRHHLTTQAMPAQDVISTAELRTLEAKQRNRKEA